MKKYWIVNGIPVSDSLLAAHIAAANRDGRIRPGPTQRQRDAYHAAQQKAAEAMQQAA